MIIPSFAAFRYRFSERIELSVSATFVMDSPDQLTRGSGSWIDDGVEVGMYVDVSGSALGNNRRYRVTEMSALTLGFATSNTVADEGPLTLGVVAVYRDPDSYERWPVALVRASGFADGLTDEPVSALEPSGLTDLRLGHMQPITLSANAYGSDSVYGVDDYDWYLSQRVGDHVAQPFTIVPASTASFPAVNTWSGSVTLSLTNAAAAILGGTLDAQMDVAWKNCHLYVRRRSNGAIQWFDLHELAFG